MHAFIKIANFVGNNDNGLDLDIHFNPDTAMVTAITEGVKVSVTTEYLKDYSNPVENHFVFTYRIQIENFSDHTIQLLGRQWVVKDAFAERHEIKSEEVEGQQPIIEPGGLHEFVSGCNLKSGIGKIVGKYHMERIYDGRKFYVNIPEFTMVAPFRLN